jgi:hypothetical protein
LGAFATHARAHAHMRIHTYIHMYMYVCIYISVVRFVFMSVVRFIFFPSQVDRLVQVGQRLWQGIRWIHQTRRRLGARLAAAAADCDGVGSGAGA